MSGKMATNATDSGRVVTAAASAAAREFVAAVNQELDRQDDGQSRQRLSKEILTVRQCVSAER